jgi:quinol monooxygenase YgiN
MPRNPVTVLIVYQALPGRADEGVAALARLVDVVVAEEPACLGITIHQDVSDPARVLLHEEWVDKASYVGPHMTTPHILAFIERAQELFAGPPDISFWDRRATARRG